MCWFLGKTGKMGLDEYNDVSGQSRFASVGKNDFPRKAYEEALSLELNQYKLSCPLWRLFLWHFCDKQCSIIK